MTAFGSILGMEMRGCLLSLPRTQEDAGTDLARLGVLVVLIEAFWCSRCEDTVCGCFFIEGNPVTFSSPLC